ncbi:hypothetical protein L1987_59989 [Smallanthus sonchifolius]|uniref:Uncharacterized protein n=1 Tax=Smallanthus sonchifolius TaxID=185202 RepID=A0ACB9D6U3_9ASTR|nr:hypothetical protein L1987_59989 [Smallanthus sonchifolius]
MESGLRSRKRKQRPSESDPFGGIFTRSRSHGCSTRHFTRCRPKTKVWSFKSATVPGEPCSVEKVTPALVPGPLFVYDFVGASRAVGPLPSINELENATDVTERKGTPSWLVRGKVQPKIDPFIETVSQRKYAAVLC